MTKLQFTTFWSSAADCLSPRRKYGKCIESFWVKLLKKHDFVIDWNFKWKITKVCQENGGLSWWTRVWLLAAHHNCCCWNDLQDDFGYWRWRWRRSCYSWTILSSKINWITKFEFIYRLSKLYREDKKLNENIDECFKNLVATKLSSVNGKIGSERSQEKFIDILKRRNNFTFDEMRDHVRAIVYGVSFFQVI